MFIKYVNFLPLNSQQIINRNMLLSVKYRRSSLNGMLKKEFWNDHYNTVAFSGRTVSEKYVETLVN